MKENTKGKVTLAASVLSADFSELGGMFRMFERHESMGHIHLDIMDGNFVPNISFGKPVVQSLAGKTKLPFDIHMMVTAPENFISDYITDNTEYIVVHAEASVHLDRTLRLIKSLGVKCGVALNPATSPGALEYVLDIVDQVLVMSVNPGFGGQEFILSSLEKLRVLAEKREARGLDFKLAIDGGITRDNILDAIGAGAEIITVGSAILNAQDPEMELLAFDELVKG